MESGGLVENETRGYDASTKETTPMRDKEVKQDYRCPKVAVKLFTFT